jgi:hypothetical protein
MPSAGIEQKGYQGSTMRFRVEPRDVPPEIAARRLGKTLSEFEAILPNLFARGFPKPDPDTGNFDLDAIDEWRRRRHHHLFLTYPERARDARAVLPRTGGIRSGQRENPVLSHKAR